MHASPPATKSPWSQASWLKLLHYKKNSWNAGWTSQIDDPGFFLSPLGKSDPQAEWEATQSAFLKNPSASCRFPARFLLLNQNSPAATSALKTCQDFQKFKSYLSAKSVSLIFSSYYLNNPSSAFGHTFLRFNQWSDPARQELLDHAVDFAANVDTQNAFIYGVKGIFGLFKGTFSLKPYFLQVRQYSAFQSRDLWSYRVKFTESEVDYLIAHLWEVGQSWIDYFYFDENCAYHILGVLEVVRPELNLTDELPAYVIPIDTIRVLKRHNLLDEPDYRPSVKTTLDHRLDGLSSTQLSKVSAWTDLEQKPLELVIPEDAPALDAALDYLNYLFPFEVQFADSPASKRKTQLGRMRASIGIPTPKLNIAVPRHEQPDRVHKTSILSLMSGSSELDKSFVTLRWRPVFHDFLDSSRGFPAYAEIEFFDTSLRWNIERKKFWLEDLTMFQVYSLSPWESLYRPLSWHLRVGAQTLTADLCPDCLAGTIEGGGGLSLRTLSLLLEGEGTLHPDLPGAWGYLAVGPTLILRIPDQGDWGLMLKGHYRYRFFVDQATRDHWGRLNIRYSISKDLSVIAEGGLRRMHPEGRMEVRFYF